MTSDTDRVRLLALPTRCDIAVLIRDNTDKGGWLRFLPAADAILNYWEILNKNVALRATPVPQRDAPGLDKWIEREFSGHGRALRTLRDPLIDGEPFMSMADAKELTRAAVVAFSAPVPQRDAEPVAWIHTLWMELGQVQSRLTHTEPHPFGLPGKDYSDEYKITSTPLYAAPSRLDAGSAEAAKYICRLFLCAQGDVCDQAGCKPGTKAYEHLSAILDMSTPPALPAGEEVRRATIEECAKYLEQIGARYHSGHDLPAHLRALSPSSNGKP